LELAGYNVYRNSEPINTEIIPATNLSFLDEDLTPDTEYCYQVEVIYNDCEEPLKTEEKCLMLLSINDVVGAQEISIFPNPTTGEFTIENGELRIENVEIFDVYGRKCHASRVTCHENINISHLQAGIYFVKIFTNTDEVVVKRLVVIK
jgi:hypothetical protein